MPALCKFVPDLFEPLSAKNDLQAVHGLLQGRSLQKRSKRSGQTCTGRHQYRYMLIDDAVAQVIKSPGGMLWCCMTMMGDVMSDMVATGARQPGPHDTVLVSPDGKYGTKPSTVRDTPFYEHLKGNPTSTNSIPSIFAWKRSYAKEGELDNTPDVVAFARKLEQTIIELSKVESCQGPDADRRALCKRNMPLPKNSLMRLQRD